MKNAQEKIVQLSELSANRQNHVIETEKGFEEIKAGQKGEIRTIQSALAVELFGAWPLSENLIPVWNRVIHPRFKIEAEKKTPSKK